MGEMLDPRAAPMLLKALGDPRQEVAEAARTALERIRFAEESKARWDRFFAGGQIDGQSAAEALILRYGKSKTVDAKVLVIRSLGKLGEAESLPFLLEWSEDGNGEIAAAASAAIAKILAED